MLFLIGIVLSINVSNKVYSMTQPNVQEYLKWNELSTNLRDFQKLTMKSIVKNLKSLELVRTTCKLLLIGFFAEKKALNNEMLEKIQSIRSFTEKYSFDIPQFINDYFKNIILVAYLILFAGWLIIFKPKNIWAWLLPITPFILIGALFCPTKSSRKSVLTINGLILNVLLIYSPEFYEKRQWFKRKSYFFMCPSNFTNRRV